MTHGDAAMIKLSGCQCGGPGKVSDRKGHASQHHKYFNQKHLMQTILLSCTVKVTQAVLLQHLFVVNKSNISHVVAMTFCL